MGRGAHQGRNPGRWQAVAAAAVIPSPRQLGGMMGCAVLDRRDQTNGATTPEGVMTCTTRADPLPGAVMPHQPGARVRGDHVARSRRSRVVSRGGHGTDVAAAALAHSVTHRAHDSVPGQDLHRLDRRPAHQPRSLFICGHRGVKAARPLVDSLCFGSSSMAVGRASSVAAVQARAAPDRAAAAGP